MYEVEVLQDDAAPEGTLDAQAVAVYMFHGEHPPPAAEREVTTKGTSSAGWAWPHRIVGSDARRYSSAAASYQSPLGALRRNRVTRYWWRRQQRP
jgi:hypothetical protein